MKKFFASTILLLAPLAVFASSFSVTSKTVTGQFNSGYFRVFYLFSPAGVSLNNGAQYQGGTFFSGVPFSNVGMTTPTTPGVYTVITHPYSGGLDQFCGVGTGIDGCRGFSGSNSGEATFTIEAPPVVTTPFFSAPTSTAKSIFDRLGIQFSDEGFYKIAIVAMSIPLVFYISNMLVELIPKKKSK